MRKITYNDFLAHGIELPVAVAFDDKDAVVKMTAKSLAPGWKAVPMPEEIYDSEVINLTDYSRSHTIPEIFGFSPNHTADDDILVGIPSPENFGKIRGTFGLRPYAIVPKPALFQVISDGDYYTVFLGHPDFLEAILGMSIENGFQKVSGYLKRFSYGRHEITHIGKVMQVCKEFNARN